MEEKELKNVDNPQAGGGGSNPHFDKNCGSVSESRARETRARKKYFDIRLRISKRVLALFVIAVMCISAVVAGFVLYGNTKKADASAGWNTDKYQIHYVGGSNNGANPDAPALFGAYGINGTVASELNRIVSEMGSGAKTAANYSEYVTGYSGINPGISGNPKHGAVYVRLFDRIDTTTPGGDYGTPHSREFTGNATIGARWWQVVYSSDGIVTFWMADPYRRSEFTRNQSNGIGYEASYSYSMADNPKGNIYGDGHRGVSGQQSKLRTVLISDFDAVLAQYDAVSPGVSVSAKIKSTLVPMNNISWQNSSSTQAKMTTANGTHTTNTSDRFNNPYQPDDLVWIPSVYETVNTSTSAAVTLQTTSALGNNRTGFWQLGAFDRGNPNISGIASSSWLRSTPSVTSYTLGSTVEQNGSATASGTIISSDTTSVRPCVSITMAHLYTPEIVATYRTTSSPGEGQKIQATVGGHVTENCPPALTIPATNTILTFNAGKDLKITGMTVEGEDVIINANEADALDEAPYGRAFANSGTTRYRAWYEGKLDSKGMAQVAKIELMNIDDKHITEQLSPKYVWGNTALEVIAIRSDVVVIVNGMLTLRYVGGINAPESEFSEINTTWYFNTLYANTMLLPSIETMNALAAKAGHSKVFEGWFEDVACTAEIVPDPVTGKIMIPVSWAGQDKEVFAKWSVV